MITKDNTLRNIFKIKLRKNVSKKFQRIKLSYTVQKCRLRLIRKNHSFISDTQILYLNCINSSHFLSQMHLVIIIQITRLLILIQANA